MPIDRSNVRGLVRAIAYDAGGSRLGRVAQVFIDDRTDEPAWVAVDVTRTRGMRLLPLVGAGLRRRCLVIRADRRTVRSAPRIDLGDGQLSSQDESRLLEHYGLSSAGAGEVPHTADHRPASPWPDDTERESSWERPTHYSAMSQDTQALSQGWEQPITDRPALQPPSSERAASRSQSQSTVDPPVEQTAPQATVNPPPVKEQTAQQSTARAPADKPASGTAPPLNRDTEPTPVTPTPVTPAPSPPTTPRPDPESQDSSASSTR